MVSIACLSVGPWSKSSKPRLSDAWCGLGVSAQSFICVDWWTLVTERKTRDPH